MAFYLLLLGGEQLAERQMMAPSLAMWMPNIILGSVGVALTLAIAGKGPSRGMR
jgi:lipopolysaccharide export system permease protein